MMAAFYRFTIWATSDVLWPFEAAVGGHRIPRPIGEERGGKLVTAVLAYGAQMGFNGAAA